MSHDAFISYSTQDKAAADATCAALEASGVRCWIAPRDITPGAEWGEAIIDAINQCRALILIFSAHANESPQIRREVERAVSKGIPIIPMRIQDIVPARSLEYFIGTVHWLDALTPPLESHLRRLVETVKALLQIDPLPPRIVSPSIVSAPAVAPAGPNRFVVAGLACLGLAVAAIGAWWFVGAKAPQPRADTPAPVQPPAQVAKASVDPLLVGTFTHDAVVDDYDWHFVYSIAADGTYRLVTTQEETGTYRGGNGQYRTVSAKTGHVRTGTYRAIGRDAIEVRSATGTAIFRPAQPNVAIDQTQPVMLGIWRATVVQGGLTWTLEIQNNPDGTYRYQGRTEDSGSCTIADQQWRTTSAATGESKLGTYRVVDARNVEFTGANGATLWRRQ
jgi:TIR domain